VKKGIVATLLCAQSLSISAHAQDFSGDVKLACEALLCLSSGVRPAECAPSLARYFGISYRYLSDTIQGRLNFLQLCPTSQQTSQMKALTSAIANGAGRCDAGTLNQQLARQVQRQVCPPQNYSGYRNYDDDGCYYETITVIDNTKPSYCVSYDGHSYTYNVGATYVGDPMNGGRWK
jgi:hypothetical protein